MFAGRVFVEDNFAGIRPISKARKKILIAIAIDVVERHCDPAPTRSAARELEQLAAGTQTTALDEMILSDVLIAINKRLHSAFEQIQIAVAVEIDETIEMAGGNFAPTVVLAKTVTVANETVIAFELAA